MKQIVRIISLSIVLSACGGGGGQTAAPATSNNTPVPVETTPAVVPPPAAVETPAVTTPVTVETVTPSVAASDPIVTQGSDGLNPTTLGVVVNDADPLSVQVGQLYIQKRKVPSANLLHVNFATGSTVMTPAAFATMKQTLDATTPANIQAYLLTWNAPYRVGTMSITSAFAFGYDVKYTSPTQCAITASSAYFNHTTRKPFTDLAMRPAMILGASTLAEAETFINRGIAADGSQPTGKAYLVSTTDVNRNVRASAFDATVTTVSPFISAQKVFTNALVSQTDVLFYFTGVASVASLTTNTFKPGAAADHLTSYGGMLTNSPQMSALKWLQAGATASYGTVVEPCNYTSKFPNPKVMMQHYLAGETMIEAYWKSVAWPGEGVFIGEPLARPFSKAKLVKNLDGTWTATFPWVAAGSYNLMNASTETGTYSLAKAVTQSATGVLNVTLPSGATGFYKLKLLALAQNGGT